MVCHAEIKIFDMRLKPLREHGGVVPEKQYVIDYADVRLRTQTDMFFLLLSY